MQEWKVYEFKELVNLSKEKYNPKNETMNLPCIELEHIESETGRLLGYTDSIEQQSIKNKFKANDILYGKLRPYLRKFYFPNFEGVCSSEIWVLQSIEEKIHNKYLYYLIQTNKFNEHANKSSGTKMPRADWNYISEITFPIPPIKEQQKIASILSTWDKAIELKEKLIEQKKQQKKGLMQKLLTGEVRLPGFKGKWKEVRIKDLGTLKGGSAFPEKYQNVISGKYPFFKVSDMNNEENEKYMLNANNYINEESVSEIKATIIPKNSIIFAKVGAALLLERKRILKYDSCIDNNMMALIVKENIDFNYVYYLLLNMKLSRFSNVGALPSLNSNDVYSLKCRLPMDYDEQKAVAELLSLFDKEINLLQNELIQIKQQKKGLMQLLLTGKVRVKV
ncbi:restriction endonuclease subunit S [Weizmannia sp. FSL W8-0676]|uniref:restriction endonuclease subunit S n=1 Tax=Weizmannia sp. FSL W8-0676 TaxID=2954703 RepID=UPI003158A94F